jgi:hypothetical protein
MIARGGWFRASLVTHYESANQMLMIELHGYMDSDGISVQKLTPGIEKALGYLREIGWDYSIHLPDSEGHLQFTEVYGYDPIEQCRMGPRRATTFLINWAEDRWDTADQEEMDEHDELD